MRRLEKVHYSMSEKAQMLMLKAHLTIREARLIGEALECIPFNMYKPLIKVMKTLSKGRKG